MENKPRGPYFKKELIRSIVWRGVNYNELEIKEIKEAQEILRLNKKGETQAEFIRDGVLKKSRRLINAHNKKSNRGKPNE